MKLRLLVFFGLLTSFFINTQAQAISNEVVFVDAKGNVLAPNATLNLNKVEESSFPPGQKQISTKLFIRNTSGKKQNVKLSYTITTLEEGQLKVCALENCTIGDAVDTYDVGTKELPANAQKEEIHADYSFPDKGKCIATLQLFIEEKEIWKSKFIFSQTADLSVKASQRYLYRKSQRCERFCFHSKIHCSLNILLKQHIIQHDKKNLYPAYCPHCNHRLSG